MPGPANPDVAWAVEDIRSQMKARQRALDYAEGRHPLNFATTKFRNTFGELFQELADNLCDDVVDEPTDRLQIENWGGARGPEAQLWWDENKGQARSGSTHRDGFRAGDGFVIVWDDGDNVPRMYVQDPRQMAVRYSRSRPDDLEVAAKCWREGKGYRLNLYYDDRIEHYYSKGVSPTSGEKGIPQAQAFQLYSGMAADGEPIAPIEPNDKGRIPVFHFPNGEVGRYGQSVLQDVYPLQDALNKSLCDMLVTSEAYAAPKRWGTGIEVPRDPVTGQEDNPFQDGKNFWWTKAKEATFGQFAPAEMKGFMEQQRMLRLSIARKGALPPYTVDLGGSGDAPSGLSLLVAEGKLVKRCKDRQRDWGDVWRELVAFALSWLGGVVAPKDLDVVWGPIGTRDEQALLEGLVLKKSLGVPTIQLLREAGYDDDQIKAFALLSEAEQAARVDEAEAMMAGRTSTPPGSFGSVPTPPAGSATPTPAGAGS